MTTIQHSSSTATSTDLDQFFMSAAIFSAAFLTSQFFQFARGRLAAWNRALLVVDSNAARDRPRSREGSRTGVAAGTGTRCFDAAGDQGGRVRAINSSDGGLPVKVLVTGGTSGLGLAMASALTASGATVRADGPIRPTSRLGCS